MGNKDEKVVLEVIDIPFEDAKKIIYKIKDMNLKQGYIMRVSQIWNYDKPTYCEYCDLKNYEFDSVCNVYSYYLTPLSSICYNVKEKSFEIAGEDDNTKIYYCPFCGRRLDVDILDRIDQKDKNLIDLNKGDN